MGTIVYTYKGQANTSGERTAALSSFVASGDTNQYISKITKIEYTHWHTSTPGRYWELSGKINFSDGTSITSDSKYLNVSGGLVKFTNTFFVSLTPEQWNKRTSIQTLDNRGSAGATFAYWNSHLYWRADESYPITITIEFDETIPVVYDPQIEYFDIVRVEDDSPYAIATIKLAIGNSAGLNGAKLYLYYAANDFPVVSDSSARIDLSGYIGTMTTAMSSVSLSDAFNPRDPWYFRLVFQTGNETKMLPDSFGRAGGSLHISGSPRGGICVGGYSSGTTDNPKFETYAPAYLYGGIAQIGNGGTNILPALGLQAGSTAAQEVKYSTYTDVAVTFPKAFASAPIVIVGLATPNATANSGADYYDYVGSCSASVITDTITASGCTIRLANMSVTTLKLGASWAAIGTPA